MKTEILKIIEAGLKKDHIRVKNYSKLLSENIADEDLKFSKEINRILNNNSIHPVHFDSFMTKPKDKDSSLEMVEVTIDSNYHKGLILETYQKQQIDNFILGIEKKEELKRHNLDLPYSLLLHGQPGTGKTAIAHLIAKKINLPLVTVKLDAVISSLLGNTAKNIRKVFEYANSKPCILFLDEFDAIAKLRDDSKELGELKRVVNSLLQNIDLFTKNNILLAATNHEKLLDPAIWRRFSTIINTDIISVETKYKIFTKELEKFNFSFKITPSKKLVFEKLIFKESPSEIKKIVVSTIRNCLLAGKESISYSDILNEFYHFNYQRGQESLIHFLNYRKVSRSDIASHLNISLRQIDNELKRSNHGEEKLN